MWRYIGPYQDPHRFTYYAGMVRHNADRTAELLDTLLPGDAEPGIAHLARLVDHSDRKSSALVWRQDGAACGFTCSDDEQMATADDMVSGARRAFPELFTGHQVPFAVIGEPIACEPPKSAPSLSAASVSSTATKAPASKPAKASAKSSA